MALSKAEYTVLADGAISAWNRWQSSRTSVDREAFRDAMAALVPHLPGPDDDPVDVQEGLHNSVETFLGTVRRILPELD